MTRTSTQRLLIAAMGLFFAYTSLQAQTIYALSGGTNLLSFSANTPATTTTRTLTGIPMGYVIVGLDVRPATGQLYGLAYRADSTRAQVLTINPMTGAVTLIGAAPIVLNLGSAGTNVGFDFNPTVDRIRVVATNAKNYRLHPVTGALAATDADLTYSITNMSDPNFGKTPKIGSCAYTNSYIASTATLLYYLDEATNTLTTAIGNPNDGKLTTVGTIAPVGIATNDPSVDLDIFTDPTSFETRAYYVANGSSATSDTLYTINLMTGVTTRIGVVGTGMMVSDIAVAIDRTMPILQGKITYGVTSTANLISFDAKNPTYIRTATAITGLKTGQSVVGLDGRPQDLKLYALGYKTTGDSIATIYTLDEATGVATVFADSVKLDLGATAQVAFDFNPVANRLRIISGANRKNFRLNLTVSPVAVIVDTTLTYKTGDVNAAKTPSVGSGAYTNNFTNGTATQLFDIDEKNGVLALQDSPNGGFLNTRGSLNIVLDTADLSVDLDITSNRAAATNTAYLAANVLNGRSFDNLYELNLMNGTTTLVGRIGLGIAVRDIAVKVDLQNSVETLPLSLKMAVSPNPMNQLLSVNFENPTGKNVRFWLVDRLGRVVLQKNMPQTNTGNVQEMLDVSQIAAGVYVLRVETQSEAAVQKVVKF